MSSAAPASTPSWAVNLPAPISPTVYTPKEEILQLLQTKTAGKDYLVVDLRRTDHEGGSIKGSLNLPAQSLHPTLPTLYTLAKAAEVKTVVWYCGSSKGRGSRAASWFQDLLNEKGETELKSVALEGGIKGWVKEEGKEYRDWIEGYDASVWTPAVVEGAGDQAK